MAITFKHSFVSMSKIEYTEAKIKILEAEITSGYHYKDNGTLTFIKSDEKIDLQDMQVKKYRLDCDRKFLETLKPKEKEKEKTVEEMLDDIPPLPF